MSADKLDSSVRTTSLTKQNTGKAKGTFHLSVSSKQALKENEKNSKVTATHADTLNNSEALVLVIKASLNKAYRHCAGTNLTGEFNYGDYSQH